MPHEPQHPDNPCALPPDEQVPAKIWELLRRNENFKRTVARLQQLDARAHTEDRSGKRPAWTASRQIIDALEDRHPFAACALQWLVPEPLFFICHVAAVPGAAPEKPVVMLETVRLREGTTRDPDNREDWREFPSWHRYNLAGGRIRRGPEIHWHTSDEPRFADKVDPLKEWRDYAATVGPFTLQHAWRQAPPGFKRTFQHLWRQRDSRPVNPITGNRSDAPAPHETTFFEGWRLADALAEATSGSISCENLAHALLFDDLARDYRLFAIPKTVRTRMDARDTATWLLEQLTRDLPAREKDLLGTPLQWDILLVVGDGEKAGLPSTEALVASFQKLYLYGDPSPAQFAKAVADEARDNIQFARLALATAKFQQGRHACSRSDRWASWQDDYRSIHAPTSGTGLIQRIFPRLADALPSVASASAP